MYKKIQIKNTQNKVLQIRLFDIPILQYEKKQNNKISIIFPILRKIKKDKPFFYLKINQRNYQSILCVQQWINTIEKYGADYCFVCDDKRIEYEILEKIKFKNTNIKFITSERKKTVKLINRMNLSKKWIFPGLAHLATFLHAHRNKIKSYWNIDVDDTVVLVKENRLIEILKEVSDYANKLNIEAFSFDMHHSFSNAHHWSYGITYIQNPTKWINIFKHFDVKQWKNAQNEYHKWEPDLNFDWFTTWLKDSKKLKIETFYFEQLYFLHCVYPLLSGNWSLSYFENGKIQFPIFEKIYRIDNIGISYVPIALDDIKFDIGITEEESFNFLREFIGLKQKIAVSKMIFPQGGSQIHINNIMERSHNEIK